MRGGLLIVKTHEHADEETQEQKTARPLVSHFLLGRRTVDLTTAVKRATGEQEESTSFQARVFVLHLLRLGQAKWTLEEG